MAGNKQAIKSRIRSVKSTKKITKAMEMIANAKLARLRKTMELNRTYASELQDLVDDILSAEQPLASDFFAEHKSGKTLSILFCSDLGLCGGYNANILKLARERLQPEDPLMVIGTNAYEHIRSAGFNVINRMTSVDSLNEQMMAELMEKAIRMYLDDEVSRIQMVYTKFVNTVTFEGDINVLLPYDREKKKNKEGSRILDIIFDPGIDEVLDNLIRQMIHSVSYAISMETRTAEQASRRMAMETASDNADDLENQLVLQYNQARQAAITQELTEIVSTADAV